MKSNGQLALVATEYRVDSAHASQVSRLALSLFDSLTDLHALGPNERRLLEFAALLHDIGWVDGQSKHHKRSYEMIMDDPPHGLSPRETAVTANIARYHRKSLPKRSHDGFAALKRADRDIVRKLAAILRIADGLDITHTNASIIRKCTIGKTKVSICLERDNDCSFEIESAQKKANLFREVFGIDLGFRTTR